MKKLALLFLVICSVLSFAQPQIIQSPSNIIQVKFKMKDGVPYYSVSRFGQELIGKSRLGLKMNEGGSFADGFEIVNTSKSSFNETWTQPWGEKKDINNNYNELKAELKNSTGLLNIYFRVYDDGIGYRYEVPKQEGIDYFEITDELSEFALTGNWTAWWIGAYQWNRYEYLYTESKVTEFDTVHTPVTFETEDGIFLSIHEAALTDYSSMALRRKEGTKLEADLFPWSDGIKIKTNAPMVTPWRTIQIADNAGGLITSYLILNLNEPNKLDDVSWIKPGKYVGIWWGMHIDKYTWGSGEKHGATTENTKKYIDFAAKYGFDGVLVEGWNKGWDGDWIANSDLFSFTEPYPDFDIEEVTGYAESKGVYIIGHHETSKGIINYEKQVEDGFDLYNKLGVKAVKTGYVGHGQSIKRIDENGNEQLEWHHGQHMVKHYRKIVKLSADKKIMLNVHEPIKPTGIRRTYPNMMTREGARGQEFDAWDPDGGNPPDHTVILPFTRLLAGPMDFTPGIFDLMIPSKPDNRVNTTLARQLAHYVILYSPLHMAADLPENYEKHLDMFQFILDVPTDWEDTKVLHSEIGDYITVVRKDRNSGDWYLGSATDENGRILDAPLSFLEKGVVYTAQIYRDGEDAGWETNPYEYVIEEKEVTNGDVLKLRLAPGGGTAVRFIPQN